MSNIDCSALSNGNNTITWRCADGSGLWSVPITYEFDVAVGIEEIGPLEDLIVFPNPVAEQWFIRLESSASFQAHIEVIDQKGAVLLTESSGIATGSDVQNIDVSGLSPGVYQLRILTEDGSVVRQFIKR